VTAKKGLSDSQWLKQQRGKHSGYIALPKPDAYKAMLLPPSNTALLSSSETAYPDTVQIDHLCVCTSTVAYLIAAETYGPEACEKVLGFGFSSDATHAIWHSLRTAEQGGWQPAASPQKHSISRMDTQATRQPAAMQDTAIQALREHPCKLFHAMLMQLIRPRCMNYTCLFGGLVSTCGDSACWLLSCCVNTWI